MIGRKKTGGRDFEPGKSGNPEGRPPLAPELKAARKYRQEELERRANKYLFMSNAKLVEKWKNPKTVGIDRMLIGIILKGAKGDVPSINFISERLIGKVPDVVRNLNTNVNISADDEKMKAAIQELENDV